MACFIPVTTTCVKLFSPERFRITAEMSFLPDQPPTGRGAREGSCCKRSVQYSVRNICVL